MEGEKHVECPGRRPGSTDVEPEAGTDGAATDDETTPAPPAAEGAETDTGDAEVGSAEVDATADGVAHGLRPGRHA